MTSHSSPVDADLAHVDWREIEELLDELARLARSSASPGEFYRVLIERLATAVGAAGAALWSSDSGNLRLEYQVRLTAAPNAAPPNAAPPAANRALLARHRDAVIAALAQGQPRVVPPAEVEAASAGDSWLIVHPFLSGESAAGAIELVESRPVSAAAGRSYLRILAAVAETVEDFHRRRELGELRTAADRYRRFDRFAQHVHHRLEVVPTAYTIASDGRVLIGCDRLSVLVRRGNKYRVVAVSGADAVERRSQSIVALEHLATRAAAAGEPLWYDDGVADLPPEIQQPLDAYLEQSHARLVAVVPLFAPAVEDDAPRRVIGALVADRFQAAADAHRVRQRVQAVAEHAALALHNALVHERMPLARAGRLLGKLGGLAEPRQLPKTALVAGILALVAAGLWWIPADFDIEARGALEPRMRREVFAADDGVVDELLVEHAGRVAADEPLVVLRKPELDLESRRMLGELRTAEKKLAAVRAERLQDRPAGNQNRRDPHELAAEEEELKEQLEGLAEQQQILAEQRRALTLRSPISGQALTWNVESLLAARPVQRGQALLTVADLDGPWVLEVRVPDDRAGYVLAAREELKPDLDVSFKLASAPEQQYQGQITAVALSTELDEAQNATLLVTVAFPKEAVPGLRPGATAIAKIHCGRRSLGFVWLHDLYDYLRSLWW